MIKEKPKKNAFDFRPWAGWFVCQEEDAELFSRLPGWRQRESRFIRDAVRNNRPFTLEDLKQFRSQSEQQIRFHIPSSLTLGSFHRRPSADDYSPEVLVQLQSVITPDRLTAECTALGEGRQLVKVMPSSGFYAFIWALALYRKDIIQSLPVSILWTLQDALLELTGRNVAVETQDGDPILAWLDTQVTSLLNSVS